MKERSVSAQQARGLSRSRASDPLPPRSFLSTSHLHEHDGQPYLGRDAHTVSELAAGPATEGVGGGEGARAMHRYGEEVEGEPRETGGEGAPSGVGDATARGRERGESAAPHPLKTGPRQALAPPPVGPRLHVPRAVERLGPAVPILARRGRKQNGAGCGGILLTHIRQVPF